MVTWGRADKDVVCYKYTRLHQSRRTSSSDNEPYGKPAVVVCANPQSNNAKNGTRIPATKEVTRKIKKVVDVEGEKPNELLKTASIYVDETHLVLNECDCKVNVRPTRSK